MRKKRLKNSSAAVILALLLFFASAQAACAVYKKSVHKEWHTHKDNFTMDSILFEVKAGGTATKVVVSADSNVVVVENGTCVDSANMSFCLLDVDFPEEELHKMYSPEDYEYHVEIYYYLARLLITKQIDNTELLIGEKARVEATIQNNGSQVAENVQFRDSYPDFFISSVIGCSFDKHNVTWSGILKKNQRKTCSYYIEATKATTFSSVAKATYMEGVGTREGSASSSSISIEVPDYELDISRNVSQTDVWVGDNFEFNVTLNNTNADQSLESVALALHVPEGIEVVEHSDSLKQTGNMLRWSGRLSPSESDDFWAIFKVKYSGTNRLKTNVNYKIGDIYRILDEYNNITGLMDKLAFQYISFDVGSESGKSARFDVNVNNPSGEYVFRNLKADVATDLPTSKEGLFFEDIGIRQFRSIIAQNMTAPDVDEVTNYDVKFNLEYETEYGQVFYLNETKTFTVRPKGAKTKELEGRGIKEDIRESIEEFGTGKTIFAFIIFVFLFIISAIYFIRRITRKVKNYEQYE